MAHLMGRSKFGFRQELEFTRVKGELMGSDELLDRFRNYIDEAKMPPCQYSVRFVLNAALRN